MDSEIKRLDLPSGISSHAGSSTDNLISISYIGPNYVLEKKVSGDLTAFMGVSRDKDLSLIAGLIDSTYINLLISAINNQRKLINFLNLSLEVANDEISESEFSTIIEKNEDNYMVLANKKPTLKEFEGAIILSRHLNEVNYLEDIEALFGFNHKHVKDLTKIIENS